MAISYDKLETKIKAGDYISLNRALHAISRTSLSKAEKSTLTKLAKEHVGKHTEIEPITRDLQKPVNIDENLLSKVNGGRSLSAKADPERIMAFNERLTHLAFEFLSVAVDFKLSKEELGRRLAAKLKAV